MDKWVEYFTRALARAEKELADFNSTIAEHGLRLIERTNHGERDVTADRRKMLEDAVEEYRRALNP